MPVTYDAGANTITVTGYTESTPCTFEDIYNADKAGTLTLIDRDGITGVDTDPVNNTYNLRPADEKVMGGAKHDLWIEIENWSGFTDATIRLIGKDEAGNDQTEDIVVTGNGTYYSDELWTELTQTQVVGVSGSGSLDYNLAQGQWGVVSKQNDNQYEFRCKLNIGDGSTETWLIDANKVISHTINDNFIYIPAHGHFRCGVVVDEANRTTKDGCFIYTTSSDKHIIEFVDTGTMELFSTTVSAVTSTIIYSTAPVNAHHKIWNCNFIHTKVQGLPALVDFYRVNWQSSLAGPRFTHIFADDITITDCTYGLQLYRISTPVTIKNYKIVNEDTSFRCLKLDADTFAINVICNWVVSWAFSNAGKIYRQYTFALKVVDKNGNPIPNASVKIWDKNNTLVVDETTDANGEIPEQTLTYGYYDQDHGNTPVMQTPHTIRIAKAGYQTYEKKFTADDKIDWRIALKHSNVCVDQEVMST